MAEDNDLNAEIAITLLESEGIRIDRARDGVECIELLEKEKAEIPIIAMTANAFEEDKKMALTMGMNDHIAKPIDMNKLIPTLIKYC